MSRALAAVTIFTASFAAALPAETLHVVFPIAWAVVLGVRDRSGTNVSTPLPDQRECE